MTTVPQNPLAGAASLVEVLRHRAASAPDRLGYRFLADGEAEEAALTYAELDRRVRALAVLLQEIGAAGERVLLLYPASLDYVVAFYGCLLAGAVAVPAYPPRPNRPMPRIRAIVADAQARFALTTTQVFATLERRIEDLPDLKALTWRTTDDLDQGRADVWRDPGAGRGTLAFLQYTSGSTALPKGVMVTHGNLLHNETLIEAACGHSSETPCVSWLPLYHDLGLIGNMIQSLYVGAPCTLMSPVSFLQSPIRWLRAVSNYGGHTSGGPNFAYELCVAKTTPEQREGLDLSSWRVAFNGAEPVRQETLELFARAFAPHGFRREALFPCYGLAETTLIVSGPAKDAPHVHLPFRAEELTRNRAVEAAPDEEGAREMVGCGRILGDQEVRIVDAETLSACPAGQVGEIWVAGPSVARGYWNRPEESEHTFGARTADGSGPFLRTGDLGFLWKDELYITGRLKDLIIIRGSNHYPQDLELTVERAHPALRPGGGAAFSVEVSGEERLVVVQEIQREHRRADIGEIAAAVRRAVAEEHEVQLWALALIRPGSLPKTTSGKIQRRQSRADFLAGDLALIGEWREGGTNGGAIPLDEPAELRTREDVEGWLAARLAPLTGVPAAEIVPTQAIVDHALDSLKAIELMHGIEARTGVSLPMESFFGGLTLAEVADRIAAELFAAPATADAARALDLQAEGDEVGDHPLSDGQRALWFLWRLEPASPAYNLSAAVGIPGEVDPRFLRAGFQALVDRHPALRTTFTVGPGGEPVQRVAEAAAVDFRTIEARSWTADDLRARLDAEALRPFDLEAGPLLRVRLYRTRSEAVLLLSLHHIVGDFWSLAVMARELGALLAGTELPALDLRYTDWVRWQGRRLAGSEGERLLIWWQERLGGDLPVLDLPADRPRPPVQTYGGDTVSLRIDPERTARLEALGRGHQATLFMTLLAGFQALLHRRTGQPDVLVGAPAAGRGRARLAGIVGYFVNPVVLRSDLVDDFKFSDFLERTRRSVLGAFEHQDYPFPALVERLQPRRDPSRSPVFQAMFALQSAPALGNGSEGSLDAFAVGEEGAEVVVGGLRMRHLPLTQKIAQFDVTLSVGQVNGGLVATLDYNTDLFDRITAERLIAAWGTLLGAAVKEPARRISELPALSGEERRQVLTQWAGGWTVPAPGAEISADALVHELFEAQVARVPNAIAAVHGDAGDQRWTYRELDARAEAVASHLRGLGVGMEDLVGLCADRTPELLAGLLGVLKTGAAYMPLDPEVPEERRAWMAERAGARVVLTGEDLTPRPPLPSHSLPPGEGAPPPRASNAAACLIYTSGSTGEPKGVILTHRNLTGLIASFLSSYTPGPGDAILPLTSVASASFVGEVLPALASGAAVVLPSKEETLDFEKLTGLIARTGVTILSTVPSLVAGLNAIHERLPKLRLLLSGGEALSAGDVDRLLGTAAVVNGYGLTETSICSTIYRLRAEDFGTGLPIPIGRPVQGHRLYVLDERLDTRPAGTPGELFVAGEGLSRGYHGNPAQTAERFLPDPYAEGGRMYRTGDRARWRSDGLLEYLGRVDQQVKIRGFRIELGEIESVLGLHPAVQEGAVVVREETGEKRLAAYVVFRPGEERPVSELLAYLRGKLPEPMIPAAFVPLEALPLSANGKLDVRALPAPEQVRPELQQTFVAPRGDLERIIAEIWREALKVEKVGVHDNFFDLGGHSLLLTRVHGRLKEVLAEKGVPAGESLSLVDFFRAPTISALARFLSPDEDRVSAKLLDLPRKRPVGEREDIAVIALSGRFPGASTPEQLWSNLVNEVESITRFTDEEMLASGIPADLVANPNYIKAQGIVRDIELFDAAFFGHNPRSAELTDPQHRVFLECAWEALERAGYDADRYPGRIGVFAGQSMNTYWLSNLYYHVDLVASVDSLQAAIGNDKDSLTTEVSYRMNLRGPSVLVQSSSSTSLTAVHYACQSLLAGECEMAITGGASIHVPEKAGYLYHEGGTTDPEGHCRTFDADAKGFVSGHGVGVVVLKRLSDALADGDSVLAVIKGSACNNDGSNKISYMAPSIDGHAEVVRLAQAAAGVEPDTITYLEAHGTGTLLGDPVEIAGLTQAFRAGTDKKQFCAIGSLKTNIGHLDTAAGVAGLIKTVLSLHNRTIPAILHFKRPNPKIDFENSPFFVNTKLRPWDVPQGMPRRAGVSSLGMGGTNTHMVLEEAPAYEPSGPAREWQLLPISAKTPTALENLSLNLASHLRDCRENSEQPLADIAWTLQSGRKQFDWRRVVVCRSHEDAAEALTEHEPERVIDGLVEGGERSVAFLFSGQGAQYVGMGRGLYESEKVFRDEVDRCAEVLRPLLGFDLRELLYPAAGADLEEATRRLQQTSLTQPALFVVEYALARLWVSRGVRPQAMVGHSIGEYVAACLAGVFELEDALALVTERGRLMQSMPPGAMLAVPLPEAELVPRLAAFPEVSLAAINRTDLCVVSGTHEALTALEQELTAQGLECRPLHTSHAFHSAMMDPILEDFTAAVERVPRRAPRLPYISNVTGTWIRPEEATDSAYWARQLRGAVRFADAVGELLAEPGRILLEVGPGNTLATASRQHPLRMEGQAVISSLRHPKEKHEDAAFLTTALAKLWLAGAEIDWRAVHAGERRLRVVLPTYPFERQRFWVEPKKPDFARKPESSDLSDWFWAPVWKRAERSLPFDASVIAGESWLLFLDDAGLGAELARRLRDLGADVVTAEAGAGLERLGGGAYRLAPASTEDHEALLADLATENRSPRRIVHLWSVTREGEALGTEALERGFHALLALARAIGKRGGDDPVDLLVVTSGAQEVTGEEELEPERAAAFGPAKVIPREFPHVSCRVIDVSMSDVSSRQPRRSEALLDGLIAEAIGGDRVVAWRGSHRWVQVWEPVRMEKDTGRPRIVEGGVYLLTGGLGGIGLAVAEHLALRYRAKLVLAGRSGLPAPETWEEWTSSRGEDDRTSRRIRQVRRLEELGAEVLVAAADSADGEAMARLREQALARFGRIDGIFHAAGVPGAGLIQTKTREAAESVLAPKVHGTRVLAELFGDQPLAFVALFSSVTSVLSQPGQADYAAANVFLDAWAHAENARGGPFTVSVNWDAWQEVGMAVETEVPAEIKAWREESLRQGVSPAQGVDALERALRGGLVQVAVSRKDFQGRIEESFSADALAELANVPEAREVHSRPTLSGAFVAPRDETERRIAKIWEEVLGIDRVGVHDNFFDLGGNSLIGLKVVSRVKAELQADLSPVALFEGPTVASMAKLTEKLDDDGSEPPPALGDRRSRGAMRREKMRQRRA
jgi:amino acid adenylation domain-containing protein